MLINGIVASGVSGLTLPSLGAGDVIIDNNQQYVITQSGYRIAYQDFVRNSDFENDWWSYNGATLVNYSTLVTSAVYDSAQNTTWTVLESWNDTTRDLMVEGYRHSTGLSTVRGRAFTSQEVDDDHGISAIIADNDGYLHVIGGSHTFNPFKYAISARPNDPSEWVQQSSGMFPDATYPKLFKKLDGNLVMYYRRDLDKLSLFQTTSVGSGSATWGSQTVLWQRDFSTERIYPSIGFLDGDDLWIVACQSNNSNSLRWDVFVLVYNLSTGTLYNHNKTTSVSSGSLPINDTLAESDFRVADWNNSLSGWYPDIYRDSSGVVHIVYLQGNLQGTYDIYHMYKNNLTDTSFTTPELIANVVYSNAAPMLVESGNTLRCWFIEDENNDFSGFGGNLYYVDRSSGIWGSKTEFYSPDVSRYGVHRPHRVKDGINEIKTMISERAQGSLDSVAGGLKTYLLDANHSLIEKQIVAGTYYTSLLSSLTGTYTEGRRRAIDSLFNNLDGWGILDLLDALWFFNGINQTDALINWVNPGTFDATLSGSPVFISNEGISTDGSTNYIDLNLNPSTSLGNYTQNSASFGFWCLDSNGGTGAGGALSADNGVFINPSSATNVLSGRINTSGANMSQTGVDSVGLTSINRDSSTSSNIYKYGNLAASSSEVSEALVNQNMILGGTSGAGRAQNFSAAWVGASLTRNQHLAMSIAIGSYIIGVTKGSLG